MAKSALFVVDTPGQVFNIREAIRLYGIDRYDLIVNDCCRADAYAQLLSLIQSLKPGRLFTVPRVTGAVDQRIAAYAQHLAALRQVSYDKVFFSNIRQQWQRDIVCSLPSSCAVLMDDGNAVLVFYPILFSKQQFFDFPPDPDLDRAALAAKTRAEFHILTQEPTQLELFSIFSLPELPWLKVTQNPMSGLHYQHQQVNKEQVILLGGGAVELNFISAERYIELLQRVKQRFADRQLIYVPHRIASAELLTQIQQQVQLQLMRLDQPIEEWLYHQPCPPGTIAGFYSMALATTALCFPALEVISLDPGLEQWSGAASAHVWNMTQCNNLQSIDMIMSYYKTAPRLRVEPMR